MKRTLSFLLLLIYALSTRGQTKVMSSAELQLAIEKLGVTARVLYVAAHPDDENTNLIAYLANYRHYDTIYTERYLYTPQENKKGYDEGSAMTYVKDLKGRLMIYYGTADDNVHPNNAMQLIQALQRAGKSFEVQVGPDLGHTAVNQNRMMEFFIENLVMRKD